MEQERYEQMRGIGSPVHPTSSHSFPSGNDWDSMRSRTSPHSRGVLGVWSPFGQVYAAHGEVMLKLGKKPTDPAVSISNCGGSEPTSDQTRPEQVESRTSEVDTAPPLSHASPTPLLGLDLGLGLGLHPQRFPRELLRSSERRVRKCCASSRQLDALSISTSEPSLRMHTRPIGARSSPSSAKSLATECSSLPLISSASRYAADFQAVQRSSRLKLEAALEERARIRATVLGEI